MKRVFQILIVLLISLSSFQGAKSQQEVKGSVQFKDSTDQAIFNSIREMARSMSIDSLPLDNRVIEVAKMFMQTPYVGGTLDGNGKEQLVVNFRELDCTTYVENVVTLSKVLSNDSVMTDDFLKELENLRYRNGKLTDYASRLHYFSDWIYDNEQRGMVENITAEMGGEKYNKTINFMSTHVSSYPALKADTSLVEKIRKTENEINKRELFFIPETKIQQHENQIHNGDIIAITTVIKGLDISHVGIAIHVNNRLHLMNASSKAKKVVTSDIPLAEMLLQNKYQSGIMVARLQ